MAKHSMTYVACDVDLDRRNPDTYRGIPKFLGDEFEDGTAYDIDQARQWHTISAVKEFIATRPAGNDPAGTQWYVVRTFHAAQFA